MKINGKTVLRAVFSALFLIVIYWGSTQERWIGNKQLTDQESSERSKPVRSSSRKKDERGVITVENSSSDEFLRRLDEINDSLTGSQLAQSREEIIDDAFRKLDCEALIVFCRELRGRPMHSLASGLLANKLAIENPELGFKWLVSESQWKDGASSHLVFARQLELSGFPKSFVEQLADPRKRLDFVRGTFNKSDFETISRGVQYLLENPDLTRLNGSVLALASDGFLARKEYDQAVRLLGVIPPGSDRNEMTRRIFRAISNEPDQAIELLKSLHSDYDKVTAVSVIAGDWVMAQPEAAADWTNSLTSGAERDSAKSAISKKMLDVDLQGAFEWAKSVENIKIRNSVVEAVRNRASIEDPGLLQEWDSAD